MYVDNFGKCKRMCDEKSIDWFIGTNGYLQGVNLYVWGEGILIKFGCDFARFLSMPAVDYTSMKHTVQFFFRF